MARGSSSKRTGSRKSSRKQVSNRAIKRKRRSRRRKKAGVPWLQWGLLILFILGVSGSLYSLHLDHTVRTKFEGKRWALPARVYARPLELYTQVHLDAAQFVKELERLGYRSARHPKRAGAYSRNRNRVLVRTRGFDFPDGREPKRYLELKFGNSRLKSLEDAETGKKLVLIRLEAPLIGSLYPAHKEDRVLVKRSQLSQLLVKALIAVEDRNYFGHYGVDPKGIARAAWVNLRAGRVVQGGSTLTQQLVKNFYLNQERSFWRKINEALIALLLEARYSKDEILEAYANEIYLGQDGDRAIHGFGLASEFYFGRPLGELDLPKLALLVGLIRGPSYYNPRRHPQRAKDRRDLVLKLLAEKAVITGPEVLAAVAAPLDVTKHSERQRGAFPAFLDLVRRQLHRDYREEDLTSEGLRIFTTMDPQVQEAVGQDLATQLTKLEKRHRLPGDKLEGAAVIAGRDDGEVLAVIGGRKPRYAGFNRTLDALRPIGSVIKPVVYLAALSQPEKYTLISRIQDTRVRVKGPDGKIWRPRNFDRKPHGEVMLHTALAQSYNLATVRLGMGVGLDEVTRMLGRLGVRRPVHAFPSLSLGAVSLSVLEVAQVYQTLAAGGFYSPLRAIQAVTDAQGKSLQRYPVTVSRVVSPGPVYLLTRILQEAVIKGTARTLKRQVPADFGVAGKTGTTDGLRDSWFAGFTGDKVGVVWVGRDDNKPAGLTGAKGAMRIWGATFSRIHTEPLDLLPPDSVEFVWIDPANGLRADALCPQASRIPFVQGSAPTLESSCTAEKMNFFERFAE